jgi:hypothetical protein
MEVGVTTSLFKDGGWKTEGIGLVVRQLRVDKIIELSSCVINLNQVILVP